MAIRAAKSYRGNSTEAISQRRSTVHFPAFRIPDAATPAAPHSKPEIQNHAASRRGTAPAPATAREPTPLAATVPRTLLRPALSLPLTSLQSRLPPTLSIVPTSPPSRPAETLRPKLEYPRDNAGTAADSEQHSGWRHNRPCR